MTDAARRPTSLGFSGSLCFLLVSFRRFDRKAGIGVSVAGSEGGLVLVMNCFSSVREALYTWREREVTFGLRRVSLEHVITDLMSGTGLSSATMRRFALLMAVSLLRWW